MTKALNIGLGIIAVVLFLGIGFTLVFVLHGVSSGEETEGLFRRLSTRDLLIYGIGGLVLLGAIIGSRYL